MNLKETLINNTVQAYSGERGCCCGCLGTYYYAEGACNYANGDSINDKKRAANNIKRIANKIFELIDEQAFTNNRPSIDISMTDNLVSATDNRPDNGRTYILYFS
jgi:hypothetical protein